MLNKANLSILLRQLGILYYLDFARFYLQKISRRKRNRIFKKEHQTVKLPPDYLIYESFHLDYEKYYCDGYDTAKWLLDILSKHKTLKNVKILDWGCGPGRIIRHLPSLLDSSCSIFGTDYNPQSIAWCLAHINGITFRTNDIHPPTDFQDNFFDVIYGISIFTHLSEQSHQDWIKELVRISKNDGIILITTQGAAFKDKLLPAEKEKFEQGHLVVRGKVKEGHRVYGAFHSPLFMQSFLSHHGLIIKHIPGELTDGKSEQDVWLLKKYANFKTLT